MEQDWGIGCYDGDDDFVQEYSTYPQFQEVLDAADEHWVDESDDEDSNRKRKKKSSASGKKKRKRKKTGSEYFYETILRWSVPQIPANDRRSLNLPSLHSNPTNYIAVTQYYQCMQILPIEESRVSLLRGLEAPEEEFLLTLAGRESVVDSSFTCLMGLCSIDFELPKGRYDVVKPGWIYFLFPAPPDEIPSSASGDSSSKLSMKSRLLADITRWGKNAIMASLCLSGGMSYSDNIQTFWVHHTSLAGMDSHYKSQSKFPAVWRAYAIENLISYQRMVAACHESPKPPFMPGLLGHKLPQHIKFSDGETEEGGDGGSVGCDDSQLDGVGREVDVSSSEEEDNASRRLSDQPKGSDESDSEDEENDEIAEASLLAPLDGSQQIALDDILGQRGDGLARVGGLHMVQGPPGERTNCIRHKVGVLNVL